jgi:hypothetical protein
MKLPRVKAIVVTVALVAAGSGKVLAADPEVEALKNQLNALQAKVAEMEKEREKAAVPAATPAAPAAAEAASREALQDRGEAVPRPETGAAAGEAEPGTEEAPASIPPGHESPVTPRDNLSDEQEAAPRPDDLTLDPKFLGFIPVPRTPVIIKFNAKPRVDFTWDPDDTGDNTRFITAKIPLEGDPSEEDGSVFNINAKGSRMSIDVRAPQVDGAPRFYFENDFYGSGSAEFNFRVRHVYGQIYNVIVGQTFSVFEDPDVWPDTVDFEGPNSQLSRRHPQVRYQLPLSKEWGMNFSLEQPASAPADYFGTAVSGANHAPDGGLNVRWEKAKVGHVQASSIFRGIGTKSFTAGAQEFDRETVFGWGVNLAGGFTVIDRDSVQAQVTYGEGIGSYGNDTSFFDTDAAFDADGDLVALPYFGAMLGYTHWWAEQWRSSASYGYVNMDNEASQGSNAYDQTHYVSLNLVWQVRKRLSVGLEGLYGHNEVQSGADGEAWRVQVGVIYKLFD